ncbi:MAG: hypothetical protein NTV49_00715 [Kiritimatiellaeota bacterium]|nr:hypothetical protein [Kiritimatiellota bacterium]
MRYAAAIVLLLGSLPLRGPGQTNAPLPPRAPRAFTVMTPQLRATPTNALTTAIATRHFRVLGLGSADNAGLAAFAEGVADRIERCLPGTDWAADRQPPIRIEMRLAPHPPEGRVIKSQQQYNGILDQRVLLLNPDRVDREDFIEAVCWLALNRRGRQAQTAAERPVETLEWLAVGLAQNLFGELQQRNRQVVLSRWQQGRRTPWADLVRWRLLPDGRWADKAVCGVAFEWLRSWPEREELLRALIRQPPATLEWLVRLAPEPRSARDLEKNWDLWVLRGADVLRDPGELTLRQTDALRALLTVTPAEFMVGGAQVPERVTAAELIAEARQPWAQTAAWHMLPLLASQGLGRPAEFQAVLAAYAAYFEALAAQPPAGWLRRLFHFRPSRAKLTRLLAVADRQLAELEHTLAQRQQYLSQVEAQWQARAANGAQAATNAPAEPR